MPEAIPTVEYREIQGFPGYVVGDDGSVWTQRSHSNPFSGHWRQRKPGAVPPSGYLFVGLIDTSGKVRNRYVHRLVLETFVGPCPDGMQACHYDGNPANNRLSNLRWDTLSNNNRDKRRHGTQPHGSTHHNAKLNEVAVQAVYELRKLGWSMKRIGLALGVCVETIHQVTSGETWRHV